jgi:hypothetical protein
MQFIKGVSRTGQEKNQDSERQFGKKDFQSQPRTRSNFSGVKPIFRENYTGIAKAMP